MRASFDSREFEAAYTYSGRDLGATYTRKETTWKVWAPLAAEVQVSLYMTGSDDEEGHHRLGTYAMQRAERGVFQLRLKGDYAGVYYTYLIRHGDDIQETSDVYARASGVDGMRSMVVDLRATDPEGWERDTGVRMRSATDAVVWETHVGDFSSSPDSGMRYKGKYLAFTEENTHLPDDPSSPTGLAYLKTLGITHVQLMPVYDYATVVEAHPEAEQYNWGYDPLQYNVPEGSYATDPRHGEVRIREMKRMIQALHKNGIGVVMDVVYNHTYYSEKSAFHKTVPGYYHRTKLDGSFSNGSGCGNEVASERSMCRHFIVDSVRYWAEEYHIDGFRFDLMGVLDVRTMNRIRESLDALPNGRGILMYGEPWAAGALALREDETPADKSHMRMLREGIGMFNDDTRDCIKGSAFHKSEGGFVNGGRGLEWRLENAVRGWCGPQRTVRTPDQTVTYCSAHDNFTLWDKLVYTVAGPKEGFDTADPGRMAANRMAAALVLTSQGLVFLHSGEEFARSKHGEGNSYRSPIAVNRLEWGRTRTFRELVEYYRGLLRLRGSFSAFRDPTERSMQALYFSYTRERVVAYTLPGLDGDPWEMVAVLANADDKAHEVLLETWSYKTLPEDWDVLVNDRCAGTDTLGRIKGGRIAVPPRSVLVLGAPRK